MAGSPFELVEQLSTCATFSVAREFLDRQRDFAAAKEVAEKLFARRIAKLSDDAFKMWRTAIRQSRMPSELGMPHPPEFKRYVHELAALTSVGENLEIC